MTVWRTVRLGDVLPFRYGKNLPKPKRSGTGEYAVVSSAGFIDSHQEALTSGPSVVIGRKGSIGSVFYSEQPVFPIDTTFFVEGSNEVDIRFGYYLLKSLPLASMNTDAAVPGLNRRYAEGIKIQIPPLKVQHQITHLLGGLDDLIENNSRRITVLEEMATSIYQEWFVHFRYPGHEGLPLVESEIGHIPRSWGLHRVGDVLELKYGKALKASERRNGKVAVVGSSGVIGWHDVPLVDGPAIVIGRKGNVGSVTWLEGSCWPIDTTYYVDSALPLRFVAEQLRAISFINSHAAVPGLSRDVAYSRAFLLPPPGLLDRYEEMANTLGAKVSNLNHQNSRLEALRDLLLPPLVNGRIDASSLDLEGAVGAVDGSGVMS